MLRFAGLADLLPEILPEILPELLPEILPEVWPQMIWLSLLPFLPRFRMQLVGSGGADAVMWRLGAGVADLAVIVLVMWRPAA